MRANDWIRVEDRLPEEGVKVLCVTKNNQFLVTSTYIPKDCKGVVLGPKEWKGSSNIRKSITHWMPIVSPDSEDVRAAKQDLKKWLKDELVKARPWQNLDSTFELLDKILG